MNGKASLLVNKKFKKILWYLTSEMDKMTVNSNLIRAKSQCAAAIEQYFEIWSYKVLQVRCV